MNKIVAGLSVAGAVLAAAPAFAHIVLAEPHAASGAYYAGFFRVSHGCGASPTTALRIEMPAGVTSAKPQPKAGWTVEIEKAPLPQPVKGEGGAMVSDRVVAVTWRGALPADQFDQFGVMMKLPAEEGMFYFPAVQTCESGEARWTGIPAEGQAWHDLPNPAPVLHLAAPEAMPMDHNHH